MKSARPWTRAALLHLLLISLLLPACIGAKPDRTAGNTQAPQTGVDEGVPTTSTEAPPSGPPPGGKGGRGTFVVVVTDQNDRPAEGIHVKIAGPLEVTSISDGKGEVRIEGAAGYYTFKVVAGCFEKIQVLSGGGGKFGIAAGQTGRGQTLATWQHRVAPSPPVFSDPPPEWSTGKTVTFRYDVIDRCGNKFPKTPGASFPTWAFETGPTLRLAEKPLLKADGSGYGYVKVVCLTEGVPELYLIDSRNPQDELDLIAYTVTGDFKPRCRNPGS